MFTEGTGLPTGKEDFEQDTSRNGDNSLQLRKGGQGGKYMRQGDRSKRALGKDKIDVKALPHMQPEKQELIELCIQIQSYDVTGTTDTL